MKKIFTLIAMALMAVGANAQTLIAEMDWTKADAFTYWCSGENESTATVTAEGLEINVPAEGENNWNPQTVVLNIDGQKVADNPDAPAILEEDGIYKVVITCKHPAGHLQVNLGSWDDGVSLQDEWDVEAKDEFYDFVYEMEGWPADCFSGVHVLWQSGKLVGKSVIQKVQVWRMDAEPGEQGGNEEIVDITPNFTYTWNGAESIENNEDGSITFHAVQWGGLAAWVAVDDVPVDWSGYSKVVFEFAEPTEVNTQILVGDAKAWGEVGITSLECPFEGVDMSAISQIALQTSDATTIVVKRVYLVKAGATGIQSIQAAKAQDGAIYNLAGQKVNASYKGVVIKNGKKYFQK